VLLLFFLRPEWWQSLVRRWSGGVILSEVKEA
jgi:hypothetical protein